MTQSLPRAAIERSHYREERSLIPGSRSVRVTTRSAWRR